jgi:hypothetical protein
MHATTSSSAAAEEEEDLPPWWSKEELQQFGNEYEDYFAAHPDTFKPYWNLEQSTGYTAANTKWIFYKRQVLDKYDGNPLVDSALDDGNGYEYIRFLSLDKSKPPEAIIRFLSGISNTRKNFVNVPEDANILAVREQDTLAIPPKQRAHWRQHRNSLITSQN